MSAPHQGDRTFLSLFARQRLGDGEIAIGAVRNHRLTRLEAEPGPIELHRDQVRLEAQRLGVQQSLRQRLGEKEPADWIW